MSTPIKSLYTKVQNCSGATRKYQYLGQKGVTLASNAVYRQPGHLPTVLVLRDLSFRLFSAFEKDVDGRKVEILQTPAVYLEDTVGGAVKNLKLTSGSLAVGNPQEGTYWGSDPA